MRSWLCVFLVNGSIPIPVHGSSRCTAGTPQGIGVAEEVRLGLRLRPFGERFDVHLEHEDHEGDPREVRLLDPMSEMQTALPRGDEDHRSSLDRV